MANDNWKDDSSQAAALQQANIAPTRDEESAIIVNVPAGTYTAPSSRQGQHHGRWADRDL